MVVRVKHAFPVGKTQLTPAKSCEDAILFSEGREEGVYWIGSSKENAKMVGFGCSHEN